MKLTCSSTYFSKFLFKADSLKYKHLENANEKQNMDEYADPSNDSVWEKKFTCVLQRKVWA